MSHKLRCALPPCLSQQTSQIEDVGVRSSRLRQLDPETLALAVEEVRLGCSARHPCVRQRLQ